MTTSILCQIEANPVYNEGIGKGFLLELSEDMLDALVNGNQIKIGDLFTCHRLC